MLNKNRFWEIDFLRGIAIVVMIIFHFLLDLNFFFETEIHLYSGIGKWVQQLDASLFLLLVGISLSIKNVQTKAPFIKYLKRVGKMSVICGGMTLVTFLASPSCYIGFGILHLICFSIIFSYLFGNFKHWNIALGLCLIIVGYKIRQLTAPNNYYFIFGYTAKDFTPADYFPVLPYFGVVLLGLGIAPFLYNQGNRQFKFIERPENFFVNKICFLGKHSLIIYLTHQIVLCGILFCIAKIVYEGFKVTLYSQ